MAGDPAYDSHLLCEKFCEGHEGEGCLALSLTLLLLYQHQLPFLKPVPSTAPCLQPLDLRTEGGRAATGETKNLVHAASQNHTDAQFCTY